MIEYEGETYVTTTEVAQRFRVSRGTCYNNILQHMQACYLPGRKNAWYRLSDVEQFSQVRTEANNRSVNTVDIVRPNVIAARQVV